MVGVPGRSKGCVTCRRRKKGVSSQSLAPALLIRPPQQAFMNTTMIHSCSLAVVSLGGCIFIFSLVVWPCRACIANYVLSPSVIKTSRRVTNAYGLAYNAEAMDEILFGSTPHQMEMIPARLCRYRLEGKARQPRQLNSGLGVSFIQPKEQIIATPTLLSTIRSLDRLEKNSTSAHSSPQHFPTAIYYRPGLRTY